jgi:hypothetical protein
MRILFRNIYLKKMLELDFILWFLNKYNINMIIKYSIWCK